MEIHRLKPMKEGYPEELFNKLYQETKNLRRSLANQIDSRRYGVSKDIIESWFDDKFIFVFNKYFESKEPELLKAYIINALKTFKLRILRKAYNKEGLFYCSMVELEGENELINFIPDDITFIKNDDEYDLAIKFMRERLSDNAYIFLQIQLNPPPYILERINNHNSRIPNKLIAEYLSIDTHDEDHINKVFKNLKKEINKAIKSAKDYFNNDNSLALSI